MRAGDVIAGRFELEAPVGAGGMGAVFRARDGVTGGRVAVKLLRDDGRGAARLLREGRVLAELDHPRIVRYVEHGAAPDGTVYLVMEWLDGEDLHARLARAGLTMAETVTLAEGVAEALAAAHARGVVHRDVKPRNLYLPGGDVARVKVLDFGIARWDARLHAITATGLAVGTPGYMAPEQARGERHLDARADVFALGCVLYECLTGRGPFTAHNAVALLARILLEDAPRVASARDDVPDDLDALVAAMLARDPARRLADGAAVREALAELAPIESARPSMPGARPPSLTSGEQRLVCVGG